MSKMTGAAWTVQRSKRKTPSTATSTTRKRVRISDDVDRRSPSVPRSRSRSRSKSKSQQTLTQIAFVNSPQTSFEEDPELQEILRDENKETHASRSKRSTTRKRVSTLTQMPWLNTVSNTTADIEDEMLPQGSRPQNVVLRGQQLDGPHDDVYKARLRQTSPVNKFATEGVSEEAETKTQEYKPRKRRRKTIELEEESSSARRRSGRIASKEKGLPDATNTSPTISRSAKEATLKVPERHEAPARSPVLEIQDSTEWVDEEILRGQSQDQQMAPPQTPRRDYIASSQTPESRPHATVRRRITFMESPSKSAGRAPLQERSTNPLLSPRKFSKRLDSAQRGSMNRSPPRKVCVLKVPSREVLLRSTRIDDSQRDIYSLQITSPLEREKISCSPLRLTGEHAHVLKNMSDHGTDVEEIPESTDVHSSPHIIETQVTQETQESLPSLSNLIPSRKSIVHLLSDCTTPKASHRQAAGYDAVAVQDFCGHRMPMDVDNKEYNTTIDTDDEMLLKPRAVAGDTGDGIEDDVEAISELDSPILNDTQFNIDLGTRTSSPVSTSYSTRSRKRMERAEVTGVQTPTRNSVSKERRAYEDDMELDPSTPLPIPRLVQPSITPVRQTSSSNRNGHSEEEPMLPHVTNHSSLHLSTTKVPLNDTFPTSSPPLLSTQRHTTQRSIHPASMLRPSQVSTQDATQLFLPPSTAQNTQFDGNSNNNAITIKDSSSMHGYIRSIPEHQDTEESEGLNLRLFDDTDDDVDDLDLDPSIGTKHSARKPVLRMSSGADSTLRSIHPSSDALHNSSSSPDAKARMTRQKDDKSRGAKARGRASGRDDVNKEILELLADIPTSSPDLPPLKRKYSPIPGFDNDTQSNYKNGQMTAAYIHRQREAGNYPDWFVPKLAQKP